jgi:molybdate transport system substrate-binding protein
MECIDIISVSPGQVALSHPIYVASSAACPSVLTIAAAADLKFALDDLVKEFEEKYPATKVNVTYGSSGNFFAQFQNGAPFDLFFSADIAYPRKLVEKGLGADDVFLYAIGCIVVWVSGAA